MRQTCFLFCFVLFFTLNYRRSYKRCLSSVKRKAWRGHEPYRLLSGILQSVCLSKCSIYRLSSCWRVVDRNNFVPIKVWTVRSCISQVMWDYVFHANRFRVELNNLLLEFSETNLIRRKKLRSLHSIVAMLVQCFPVCSIHCWIFLFNVNTMTDRTFYSEFIHFGIETRKEGKLVPRQLKGHKQHEKKERS